MIENTHSVVKFPSSSIYLLEYFEKLGYNIKIHEDFVFYDEKSKE